MTYEDKMHFLRVERSVCKFHSERKDSPELWSKIYESLDWAIKTLEGISDKDGAISEGVAE